MQAVRLDWTPRNRITIPLTGISSLHFAGKYGPWNRYENL